jgi:hypothetical protein
MTKIKLIENITDEQLLQIEKKLLRRSQLKLKDIEKERFIGHTPYFILNSLFLYSKTRSTHIVKSGNFQCGTNKNRSQGDLYMLMRYYCPGISFKNFRKLLLRLLNNGHVNSIYCCDIHKRVFYKSWNSLEPRKNITYISNLYIEDEFGYTLDKFNDGKKRIIYSCGRW